MLTAKQRDALEVIKKFQDKFGYPPSMRELQAAMNLSSVSNAHHLVASLEERGFIRRLRNRARAIEVVENPHLPGPTSLSTVWIDDLVKELARRGFVVGRIVEEIHHEQGSAPRTVRKFKKITEEEVSE